jgi:isopentenyl-diphosphate Delta-isomerase
MSEPKEYIDVLDCAGKKTGQAMLRADVHHQGQWHGAFHCLIVHRRSGNFHAFFQLRSRQKLLAPGRFDVTVGGHYSTGEEAGTAGPRECREELGITTDFSDFMPVERRVFVYCFDGGLREFEFQDVFLLERELDPGELALQHSEVDGLLELEVSVGIALFSHAVPSAEGAFFHPRGTKERRTVAASDFVPCLDNYYLKLLLLARRFLLGERDLLII